MDEPLAALLLPAGLEHFELQAHARGLLSIPRVIALEPSRVRTPRLIRTAITARQAARLRFPGSPLVFVLYHPSQYPLARALCARYEDAELWYVAADTATLTDERDLQSFDQLARQRAAGTLTVLPGIEVDDEPLRRRLRELEVISPRPFLPEKRFREG